MQDHLFHTLTLIESEFQNCGVIVTGDFNRLNVSYPLNHFCLKQIVKIPTRKEATVDLIMTNMHKYYNSPQGFPAFGLSDHNTVVASPKILSRGTNTKKVLTICDKRTSRKAEMGRYLAAIDWSSLFAPLDTCEDMWNVFHTVVQSELDILMPIKQIRIHPDDAPWINQRLKSFIQKRQEAFNTYGVNSIQFKQYRNLVNRERKICRAKYYESKIQQFKGVTPRKWCQKVKRLSGMKSANANVLNQINIEEFSNLTIQDQADAIIAAFLSPLEEYRMSTPLERLPLEDSPEFLTVTEERVLKVKEKLNPNKTSVPDRISNWLLKEYSYIIAFPIMKILNFSFHEQSLPTAWRMADVVPLPKKKPVNLLEKDLRQFHSITENHSILLTMRF